MRTPLPAPDPTQQAETAIRVADLLADAVPRGPRAALQTARALSDEELRLGLDFVATVLDVASGSARAIATVLAERLEPTGPVIH